MKHKLLLLLIVVTLTLMTGLAGCSGLKPGETSPLPTVGFDVHSPLPTVEFDVRTPAPTVEFDFRTLTPQASPLSTPSPWPLKAQQALQYVSEREGISEGLQIVNVAESTFPLTERVFLIVLIMDFRTPDGLEYVAFVDLADGHIKDDLEAVELAEDMAYQAKYGKLHPSLYERLQEVDDDYLLPVAIWLAPAEDEETRGQLLVDDLESQGFTVKNFGTMPSISVTLPKRVIMQLNERDDVGIIYLIEEQGGPL